MICEMDKSGGKTRDKGVHVPEELFECDLFIGETAADVETKKFEESIL